MGKKKDMIMGKKKDMIMGKILMGQDNDYTPILIDKKLENSMFTQLYLLGGAGQDIFEPVHAENGVMLFNVNFDKVNG